VCPDFSKRSLQLTADGSHTVVLNDTQVHYHSVHGAVQESKHVFLKMGWEALEQGRSDVHILEIGFGTGLNTLLQYQLSLTNQTRIHYTALEAYPLELDLALSCNYAQALGAPDLQTDFERMHTCAWNTPYKLSERFVLEKLQLALEKYVPASNALDLIYFDAFAPTFQPELWTVEVFRNLFNGLREGGILVTYCAKGDVRRAMQAAGFVVERLAGPPGKREMLRGRRG
jgi:tRNA U34 5-methylaminomethyl-2-thiouridine-forming methyltransferase MnmC